ncbi:MAG: hypothetical protein M5U01_09570 [Ardenticatenaceae bacterium]|nr:hypothetical protein [Ardenticatenaceae bacterium]
MSSTLLAGVARVEITPPLGLPLLHPLREGVAVDVESPLTATALVVSDGTRKMVIVACDLIYLRGAYGDGIRARVAEAVGTPTDHVLLNCSHTHAVPPMPGWEAPTHAVAEPLARYYACLEEVIPGAARWAAARLTPARVGAGRGRARIGVNRRERLPDGRMILGENPEKPVDEEVGVLRFDDPDGRPLALVMNYACHPDVLGPRVTFISPDYVGHARSAAERLTGVPALFLQGAGADIDPITSIVLEPDGRDEIKRLGLQLGAAAASVFADIRTRRRRAERLIQRSVSGGLAMWSYGDVTEPPLSAFAVTTRRLTLPLLPLPSLEEAAAEVRLWEERLAALEAGGAPLGERQVAARQLDWAHLQREAVESGEQPRVEMTLQAIRLNDVAFVAIPGEPFVEIGLNIKRQSPIPYTFVCGYSNGCITYIPTPAAFLEGGYEVNRAQRNYMLPSGTTPEWAGAIEAAALEMLAELCAA